MVGTGRWTVHLPPSARQWAAAVALVVLTWCLLMGYALASLPGPHRAPFFWIGSAGFLSLAVTVGYIAFLRKQSVPLEISDTAVTLLARTVPRVRADLARWRHFLHEGAVLTLPGPDRPLRLGVSHRLPAPALQHLWRADARVDAILSPPDFSDVAVLLGAGDLGWEPPPHSWRRTAGAPWALTIAFFCALAVLLGATGLAETLTRSLAGQMALQTVCFGAVAVGMVFTIARASVGRTRARLEWRPGSPAAPVQLAHGEHAAPSFVRSAARALGWTAMSMALAAVVVTPIFLITGAFERWVDIPACQAQCAAHDLPYDSFAASKSGTYCRCGAVTFHDHANVFGGHGILAGLLDWLVRSVALVGGMVAWIALIVVSVMMVGQARARRRGSAS
jgi:hypothetical protein